MAKRIQLKRTKGWRLPDGAVHVARPGKWGNIYRVEENRMEPELFGKWRIMDLRPDEPELVGTYHYKRMALYDALKLYRIYVMSGDPELVARAQAELAGKDLACWCAPGEPCHADILLQVANNCVTATGLEEWADRQFGSLAKVG